MKSHSEFGWFLNTSEIKMGGSSVLGENYVAFYIIHVVAMCVLITSVISCVAVISSILWGIWKARCHDQMRKRSRMDFADRFPFYIALGDGLWGISHLADHVYLVTTQHFPYTQAATNLFSLNVWIFGAYQQLMHVGLAIYTYLRIVRGVDINLGTAEWKLHATSAVLIIIPIAIFFPLDAYGLSGYWVFLNINATAGSVFGFYIAVAGAAHALGTTIAYLQIKGIVERQKQVLKERRKMVNKKSDRNSTASECLTTFVAISVFLYCPLPILNFAFAVETMFGVIEPITVTLTVIAANSSGWVNALGYFHNLRIKAARERRVKAEKLTMVTATTSNGESSSRLSVSS